MLTRQLCHGGGRMEADLKLIKINYLVWESVLQIKWADVPQCRTSPGGLLSRAGSHRGCWALQEHHRAISAWNTKMFVQLLWFLHTTGATWHAFTPELQCWAVPHQEPSQQRVGTQTCYFCTERLCHTTHYIKVSQLARPDLIQAQQGWVVGWWRSDSEKGARSCTGII